MKSIRKGVFETNSSSTHSLTMCSESQYDKWKKGELLLDTFNDELISLEEIKKKCIEKAKERKKLYLEELQTKGEIYGFKEKYVNAKTDEELFKAEFDEDRYKTFDSFYDMDCCGLETFEQNYTTPNGEKIIAFGYFGYDG